MPEHEHGHHGPPDTSKGYEQSDLGIPGILKGVVAYFIFTAAVGAVVLIGFIAFHQNNPNPSDLAPTRLPPQPYPLLQNDVTAHTDIWNLRSKEAYLLENTTYVDKTKGILRIPIEDAIDKAAALGPKGEAQVAGTPAGNDLNPVTTQSPSGTVASMTTNQGEATKPGSGDPTVTSQGLKMPGSDKKVKIWAGKTFKPHGFNAGTTPSSKLASPPAAGGNG